MNILTYVILTFENSDTHTFSHMKLNIMTYEGHLESSEYSFILFYTVIIEQGVQTATYRALE